MPEQVGFETAKADEAARTTSRGSFPGEGSSFSSADCTPEYLFHCRHFFVILPLTDLHVLLFVSCLWNVNFATVCIPEYKRWSRIKHNLSLYGMHAHT